MKKIAIYAGSFDPITNGHIDIIKRALKLFEDIIVLVAVNPDKKTTFSVEERVKLVKESLKGISGVAVSHTTGLTINYAKRVGAKALVRGLRAATDFEYEFQLMSANRFIDEKIESVFLMAKHEFMFISSSNIKEMHKGGVNVSALVPPSVLTALKSLK